MGRDLLNCKFGGKIVFSTDNNLIKNQIINILIDIPCTISDTISVNKKGEKIKAKKFIINEFTILKLLDNKLLLWLQVGMEIFVYNEEIVS